MEYNVKICLFWAGFFPRVFPRVFKGGFTQKRTHRVFLGTYPGVRTLLASLYRFLPASICDGALGSCNSVCLSVCLSHAWIVRKLNDAQWIFWYHTKWHITLLFSQQQWLVGEAPSLWNLCSKWPTPFEKRSLRPISACNVSTVKDREKSLIMMNIKSTTGFPMSYKWSAYVTPKSRKGSSKSDFFVFLEWKSTSIK